MIDSLPRTTPDGSRRQLVGLAVDHQGMAGIVAALEAHHDLGPLGQPVDDLALAFVAPLGADHRHIRHCFPLLDRRYRAGHEHMPATQPPRLGCAHHQPATSPRL